MRAFRFTIAGLLGVVLACGVSFAALMNPTEIWARVILGLVIATVVGSAVGAILRRRLAWGAFAAVGLIALGLLFGPWTTRLRLAPAVDRGLERIYPKLHPEARDGLDALVFTLQGSRASTGTPYPVTRVVLGSITYQSAGRLVQTRASTALSNYVVFTRPGAPDSFLRIGRALLALAAAGLGGLFVPFLVAILGRRRRGGAGPVAPPEPIA